MSDTGERTLRPVDRYEWTHMLKRARLRGYVAGSGNIGKNGRATRGAISGAVFKAVAMVWASFSDEDGGNIRPGDATVAIEAEVGIEVVRAVKSALIVLGLTERTKAGTRATGFCDVYRLTLPDDLRDRIEVLTEAQHEMAVEEVRQKRRRKPRTTSTGPRTPEPVRGPVDPVQEDPITPVPPPPDPVQEGDGESRTGSTCVPSRSRTGSGGGRVRGPVEACTNHDQPPTPTNHSELTPRTAVTVSRASPAVQDRYFPDVVGGDPPPAAGESARCEHGLPPSIRCPACRRGLVVVGLPPPPNDDPDPPDREHLADVLTFRPRTA